MQALAADLKSKLLLMVLAPALLLGGCGSASAAVFMSIWTDGNSNWNNAANWNPVLVPSNNATNQFIPIINNGSTVTLDISPTVNALGIDFLAPPASSLFIGCPRNQIGTRRQPQNAAGDFFVRLARAKIGVLFSTPG